MKKAAVFLALGLLLWGTVWGGQAQVERAPVLDAAFSLLEEDNIFLLRYNALTGAEIEARFPQGVPYFFGGNDDKHLLFSRYPDYCKKACLETTKYYREGQKYIYGLDCSGFTRWVYREAGKPRHDTLSNMILLYQQYAKNYVFTHRDEEKVPFFCDLYQYLQVGDLLVAKHGARHIMMYIGTLFRLWLHGGGSAPAGGLSGLSAGDSLRAKSLLWRAICPIHCGKQAEIRRLHADGRRRMRIHSGGAPGKSP